MHLMLNYDTFVLLGDFNSEPNEPLMQEFLDSIGMRNLVKETTCYKNLQNPTCIDLILTNRQCMFQNTKTVGTGLSDFHKMPVTVLKTAFKKSLPQIITYRDYKRFFAADFGNELYNVLYSLDIFKISNDTFSSVFIQILNAHCPLKQKYVRANESPFMKTQLRKAIMVRSRYLEILGTKRNATLPSLPIQNKGTSVLTFFVKLNENTLVNWNLKRFLTIKLSGKLLSPFSVKNITQLNQLT